MASLELILRFHGLPGTYHTLNWHSSDRAMLNYPVIFLKLD